MQTAVRLSRREGARGHKMHKMHMVDDYATLPAGVRARLRENVCLFCAVFHFYSMEQQPLCCAQREVRKGLEV